MKAAGRRLPQRLMRNVARDWALLFLAVQVLATIGTSSNPNSRWAMMAAMAADGTVRIDNYYQYSGDWSRTPDGHYYSNKAPGAALLAFPLFWVLDRWTTAGATSRPHADQMRVLAREHTLHVVSLATQAIPYALVTLLLIEAMEVLLVPVVALHVTAVALLFGNTATLFMNTFFGHGMAAMLVLCTLLAWHRRRPFWLGLFFGLAVLTDYAAALLVLPLAVLIWRDRRQGLHWLTLRRFGHLLTGGLPPAVAWVSYHGYCFGGPLALPNKFQNPDFVEASTTTPRLWGILRLMPDSHALWELLFSETRGIAFTQGWIFVCLAAVPIFWGPWARTLTGAQRRFGRSAFILALTSLCLTLWMNASFNGWDGGLTPGPRYLSLVLPLWAPVAGAIYPSLPPLARHLLLFLLALSVTLFVLVYSTHQMVWMNPLLPFYLAQTLGDASGRQLARALYMTLGFAWATLGAVRSIRLDRSTGSRSP